MDGLLKEIGVKNGQGREEANTIYFLKSGKTEAYLTKPTDHSLQMLCDLQAKLLEKLIDYIFLELTTAWNLPLGVRHLSQNVQCGVKSLSAYKKPRFLKLVPFPPESYFFFF